MRMTTTTTTASRWVDGAVSSKKHTAEMKRTLPIGEVAELLERIAAGLRRRALVVRGDTALSLTLPPQVDFELEAKSKPKRGSLELKLHWKPPLEAGPVIRIERPAPGTRTAPVQPDAGHAAASEPAPPPVAAAAAAPAPPATAAPRRPRSASKPRKRAAKKKASARKGKKKPSD